MVYPLEQRIFIALEFHRTDQSTVETKYSFQKKFNFAKGLKRDTKKVLYEKILRSANINDDRARDFGRLRAVVTDANVEIVLQVIQERSRVAIHRVAAQSGIPKMSAHHIMRHSRHLFLSIEDSYPPTP